MMCVCMLMTSKEDGGPCVLDFFFPNFDCLIEDYLFNGFSEEGLVFEYGVG